VRRGVLYVIDSRVLERPEPAIAFWGPLSTRTRQNCLLLPRNSPLNPAPTVELADEVSREPYLGPAEDSFSLAGLAARYRDGELSTHSYCVVIVD
jgi:hypothetical protein